MIRGYGTVTAGVDTGDGTILGDGTVGDGATTVGDGIPTGAMPVLVSAGVVIMDLAGEDLITIEVTTTEDTPIIGAEEGMPAIELPHHSEEDLT